MSKQIKATVIKSKDKQIIKASGSTAFNDTDSSSTWLRPDYDLKGLKMMVEQSTILPQCISAYKNNIAGFGIGVKYKDDIDETAEMSTEFELMETIIELLSVDNDTKEIFEAVIESREYYGVAYLEVMRGLDGKVNQIELIKDPTTITKSIIDDTPVQVVYYHKGEEVKRSKRFRKYKQEKNGKTVYFKEFGDTRVMSNKNGNYSNFSSQEGETDSTVDLHAEANEILEFKIGTADYGTVRWIGQVLGVDGSRRAENLNNNYFVNGRHTPLMIIVKGGSLSAESFDKLSDYMNGIKGEDGQHSFMVLEVEDTENKAGFEGTEKPSVEIKDMAAILQKDELFQDYLENSRKKVQSSFRLPDLYVGYMADYNRSTAQTAQEVTEQQVFIPERNSLSWIINNKLLNGYGFKYVEAYFKSPDITNPDDIAKILNITERAGGLSPNVAKDYTHKTLGIKSENYDGEWADIPLAVTKVTSSTISQVDETIQKASSNNEDDIVAVLRAIRKELKSRGE